jgi:hypothetical protein
MNDSGMWIWPGPEGTKKKPVSGNFAMDLVTVKDFTGAEETVGDSAAATKGVSALVATVVSMWWIALSL